LKPDLLSRESAFSNYVGGVEITSTSLLFAPLQPSIFAQGAQINGCISKAMGGRKPVFGTPHCKAVSDAVMAEDISLIGFFWQRKRRRQYNCSCPSNSRCHSILILG
jgi:hypothetical protein